MSWRRGTQPSWMNGRIDPLPGRGRWRKSARATASSALVLVARLICVAAGVTAYGLSLIGFLAGTSLGIYGAVVGSVLLLLGLPWSAVTACFVSGLFSVLMFIAAYNDVGDWTTETIFTLVVAIALLSLAAYLALMRAHSD